MLHLAQPAEGVAAALVDAAQEPSPPPKGLQTMDAPLEVRAGTSPAKPAHTANLSDDAGSKQQVNIISSDDEVLSVPSDSGCSGFAGFASSGLLPRSTTTPSCSNHSLKRRSKQAVPGETDKNAAPVEVDREVQKRASPNGNADLEVATPAKKKKEQLETDGEAEANTQILQTPPDQIVEINSNSTTNSQRQKRLLRNRNIQRRLNLNHQTSYANNNCSTESTEFPVSSPSNPQMGPGKFPHRSQLLKNTLPADSFERQLAAITARNPQMSLHEKVSAWQCDAELSDIEDVKSFDHLFKQREENTRKSTRTKKKLQEPGNYSDFQQLLLSLVKHMKPPKYKKNCQSTPHNKDKAGSSALLPTGLQKRLKPTDVDAEYKKRQHLDNRTGTNSTISTATSSSANPVERYTMPKKKLLAQKTSQEILVYDKVLCRSSSEETSLDGTYHKVLSTAAATITNNGKTKTTTAPQQKPPAAASVSASAATVVAGNAAVPQSSPLNLHWTTDEDSVFKFSRLNREIDKEPPTGLIQLRLDFLEEKKDLHLKEKACELFKTPITPHKYQTTTSAVYNNISNTRLNATESSPKRTDACGAQESGSVVAGDQSTSSFDATQLGVFHQQHEFCNYLGLTGMSTANAVANAVAELAKCNLKRRSLRVRHQQQQEMKEKSVQERKQLAELKLKQLHEMKRQDKNGRNMLSFGQERTKENFRMESFTNGSHPILSPLPGLPLLTKIKREPEIKILCQLSIDDKESPQKKSPMGNGIRQSTSPKRESPHGNASSNDTSTCPRSSHSEPCDGADSSSNPTPKHQPNGDEEDDSRTPPPLPPLIKYEPLSAHSNRSSPSRTDEQLDRQTRVQNLHNKFQMYLKASRQTQPSIFIVQSLDSTKPTETAVSKTPSLVAAVTPPQPVPLTVPVAVPAPVSVPLIVPVLTPIAIKDFENSELSQPTNDSVKEQEPGLEQTAITKSRKKTNGALRTRKPNSNMRRLQCTRSLQRHLRNRKIIILKSASPSKVKVKSPQRAGTRNCEKSDKPSEMPGMSSQNTGSSTSLLSKERGGNTTTTISKRYSGKNSLLPLLQHYKLSKAQRTRIARQRSRNNTTTTNAPAASTTVVNSEIALNDCQQETAVLPVSTAFNGYSENVEDQLLLGAQEAESVNTKENINDGSYPITSKANAKQNTESTENTGGIRYFAPPAAVQANPLNPKHGSVIYIYYEVDVLIVVQEALISFWKCSKLLKVLSMMAQPENDLRQIADKTEHVSTDSLAAGTAMAGTIVGEWVHLGECKRLVDDTEIATTYANRICIHNSLPIYVEMRCRELPHEQRDCHMLTMYINVYYYHDDDTLAKMHSVQLDAVQSIPANVIYTTLTESRYFVMCWSKENILGKIRTGLCKYSLTPQLDTLASIRDFKSMRHSVQYLECLDDDKLLGFGTTQLTIWDHRSGDVLMNYDLDTELGHHMGSMYYPSLEIGQSSVILMFQYLQKVDENPQLRVIACNISHTTPTHRMLRSHELPLPQFGKIMNAINNSEQLIITGECDEELWISCTDPQMISWVPAQNTQRFYTRGRTQLIELTKDTLTVDTFANHVLKLATDKNRYKFEDM